MKRILLIISTIALLSSCEIDTGYDHGPTADRLAWYASILFENSVQTEVYELENCIIVDRYLRATPEERTTLPELKLIKDWLTPIDETTFRLGLYGTVYYTYGASLFDENCPWKLAHPDYTASNGNDYTSSNGNDGYAYKDLEDLAFVYTADSTWTSNASTVLRFHGWDPDGHELLDVTPLPVTDKGTGDDSSISHATYYAILTIPDPGTMHFRGTTPYNSSYRVNIYNATTLLDSVTVLYNETGIPTYTTSRD